MIAPRAGLRVWIATRPIDFRRGVHGLVALVADMLLADPYGGDVFVFPKGKSKDSEAAQVKLAEMMISPAMQVAFNNKKGSIPIRTDVDTSKMDICAQAGVQAVKEGRLLEGAGEILTPDANGAFEDAVSKFWNSDQSVDDAIKAMAAALKR